MLKHRGALPIMSFPVLASVFGIRSAGAPTAYGTLPGLTVPDDLRLVCLWSAVGLTLSFLFFFVMGFGADLAQSFMAAG